MSQSTNNKRNRRKYVFARDEATCQYCGRPGDTLDHLLPEMRGGMSTRENLVVACWKCNHLKRHRLPLEFFFDVSPTVRRAFGENVVVVGRN